MSKELEALYRIANANNHFKYDTLELMDKDFQIVYQGLQRLEAIDNAKPNEALENLERLDIAVRYSTIDDEGYSLKEPRKMTNICDEEFTTIKQALIKAQEQEKELADVEKVKSGKTIIYIGKDLIMMNKAKYNEYVKIKREPVSKRILQAKCEEQEKVLEIIFEKRVDIKLVMWAGDMVEAYNQRVREQKDYWWREELTQEEFYLLKRYFK